MMSEAQLMELRATLMIDMFTTMGDVGQAN